MRRRSAFTLVELLVVVGIIAVLLGILLPSLGGVRVRARQTRCLANLRTIGQAAAMYVAEHRGYTVPGYSGWTQSSAPWLPGTPPPDYDPAVVPARKWWHNNWAFRTYLGVKTPKNSNPEGGRYPLGLMCPDAPMSFDRATTEGATLNNSYGMNYTAFPGTGTSAAARRLAPHYTQCWKANEVVSPAEKIFFADGTSEGLNVGTQTTGKPNATMLYFDTYYGGERHEGPDWGGAVAYRHFKGANVMYYDGHAGWAGMDRLRFDPAAAATKSNYRQWRPRDG